ncbi:MAG TPA: hypothetical protein VGB50_04670 [Flavobacterium sp.]|jgi:hypothetical protein
MDINEKNSWDHANRQGHNRDFNMEGSTPDMFLKNDDDENNPNKDADGHGSEAGRSDHSHYASGFGSRTGNNDSDSKQHGTRSDNSASDGSGGGGRAHGDMSDFNTD